MTLPLLFLFLFLIPLKKSHWEYLLVPTWKLILSLFGILILWLFSYVIAFLFGFVAYRDSFIEVATGQLPTMDVFYIAIIFGVVVTVLFIAWIGTIITFRIKSQDDAFWYHYFIKYRQRIMLFFVTIMYFPVLREIGVTFQCEPYVGYRSTLGVKSLLFYTDQVCPENIAQGPPMYYIASAFAAFYCIIVPIAMIIMIAVDSKQATKLYGIDSAWKEYNEAKKLFNKQKKEYEKEQRKKYQEQLAARYEDIVERYTDSVKHHSSASSTLYVGFKSWTRFYRIFQLFVRVFLVSIIVFMYNEDMKTSQGPIIGGMLVVYGLLTVIIRPYVDPLHTVADVLTHAVLVATVFIGYAGDAIPELVSSIILYVINGLNLIAVVGIIFVHPIRKRINKRADEQKTKNKLGQLRLTQQEVSYCHYTLATDEQPHEAMQEMMNQDDDGAYAIDAVPTFDLQQDKSIVQSEEINVIVSPPSP